MILLLVREDTAVPAYRIHRWNLEAFYGVPVTILSPILLVVFELYELAF